MLIIFIMIGILIFGACIGFALVIKEYRNKRNKIKVGMNLTLVKELVELFEHKVTHGN